ncbi:MAG TPA: AI-2E family transporter [Gemmatimonadaceae bacterium]|nr:AI-2E family transporter [Gemmatimonadaceae bacterium]
MLQTLPPARLETDPRPPTVSIVATPRNRAALLVALLLLLVGIVLTPFAAGLFGALVLYVLCVPAYRRLTRRLPGGLAAAIVIAGVLALIIVPVAWIVARMIQEAPGAVNAVQNSSLSAWLARMRAGDAAAADELAKAVSSIASWLSSQLLRFAGGAGSVGVNLGIALLGLYYLLRAPDGRWALVRAYIPFSARSADALRDRFVDLTRATVLGSGLVMLAQGTLVGVAFALVGLPDPIVWGAVAGASAIVPVVGCGLVWFPAALVLLWQQRYGAAATMLFIGGVIASNIDNVIRPLVYRRVSDVHPMITLVGALAGVRQFGLLGLLLGPLLIAYAFELLRVFRAEYDPIPSGP